MKKYIKDTGFTFVAQFIALGISFTTSILIARLLGPEGKGIIAIASLFPIIIAMIIGLGIDEANVYTLGKNRTNHGQVFSNFLLLGFFMSSFSILFLYLFRKPILVSLLKNIQPTYFPFIIFSIPFFLLLRYARAAFQGHHDFKKFNGFFIMRLGLNLIFTLLLIFKFGVLGAIIAIFVSAGITSIIAQFALGKYGRPSSLNSKLFKSSLSYGMRAEPGVVLNFFNKRLDMFIVNFFAGAIAVGYYSVAVAFAELLGRLPEAFGTTLFPKMAQLPHKNGNEFTSLILRNVLFIVLEGAILLAIIAKPLIFITFGPRFYPSLIPFWILLPGVLFMGITKIICSNFQGQGKPEYGTYLTIISVSFTIVLDILLIPKYGIVGAATASTISYSVASILSIIIFKKRSGIQAWELLLFRGNAFKEIKAIFKGEVGN